MDEEKFISLVEQREPIYTSKNKRPHDKTLINALWKQIGKEMGMSVIECKKKWTNLRNCYSRQLRHEMSSPLGSSERKTKWFLTDRLEFLREHMNPRRANRHSFMNSSLNEQICSEAFEQNFVEGTAEEMTGDSYIAGDQSEESHCYPDPTSTSQMTWSVNKPNEEEATAFLNFTKGLLPEYMRLTAQRRRHYKQSVLTLLNQILDEQESSQQNTAAPRLPSPTSSFYCTLPSQDVEHVSNYWGPQLYKRMAHRSKPPLLAGQPSATTTEIKTEITEPNEEQPQQSSESPSESCDEQPPAKKAVLSMADLSVRLVNLKSKIENPKSDSDSS